MKKLYVVDVNVDFGWEYVVVANNLKEANGVAMAHINDEIEECDYDELLPEDFNLIVKECRHEGDIPEDWMYQVPYGVLSYTCREFIDEHLAEEWERERVEKILQKTHHHFDFYDEVKGA